jgi:hypothetical protein
MKNSTGTVHFVNVIFMEVSHIKQEHFSGNTIIMSDSLVLLFCNLWSIFIVQFYVKVNYVDKF